ncbi:SMP-30/gluconolactonase/LRE family protein [Rhizobium sp. KVB221]|uniref:SMP-30/gluconolactonase/LRE family protein n=1 Tax=Rhizobium setariae TaxID=2801340 RepID=A0A937CLE9_9HYPH|nr:SMP-30/gluconolactonase/LRE family protein [Rhizobium setariae]MBL0371556.1 SMP-30/gluconolactonase/LRE family protein [Rhizobium setariae]
MIADQNIEFAFAAEDIVGESIVWDDRRDALLWVDIIGRRIHSLTPATGDHRTWQMPDIVTSIGLRQDGGAIVGLRTFVALWDFDEHFEPLATIEPDRPDNRLNEGVVGPDGAFWIGTMENNIQADDSPKAIEGAKGYLYRCDVSGKVDRICDDTFGITNTLVWTDDGRLITADTLKNEIYSYGIESTTNRLFDRRTILAGFPRGLPDGSCRDREGYVWNCRVAGGGAVVRLDPAGRIDRIIDLPCSWPTSCTFGGPDMSTLYVTSARFTMSEEHLANNPQEGGLFAVKTGTTGVQSSRFGSAAKTMPI